MTPVSNLMIGIASVAGVVGFILLYRKKHSRKSEEEDSSNKLVMYIPNNCIPYIFGKYGCVLKILQNKCSTRFSFTPPGVLADETKVVMKGDPENLKLAQSIINSMVRIFAHESRTGVDLEEILSKGDVFNSSSRSSDENEILTEILKLLSPNNQSSAAVEQNKQDVIVPDLQYEFVQNIINYRDRTQKLVSIGGDKRIPIYVSAVAYPNQFWVQALCTKEHAELDQMTQDLYDFFDFNPEFNFPPEYETIKIGNLYAVYTAEQKNWYRVEVVTVEPKNEANPLDTIVDLYFLDYGYSLYTPIKDIRILPVSFLELNFQAIECCAANIKPVSGDEWPVEAIEMFETLTHSAMWYKIHAIIESVIEGKGTTNPIPVLTLIDANDNDLNINNEMVQAGFAQYST